MNTNMANVMIIMMMRNDDGARRRRCFFFFSPLFTLVFSTSFFCDWQNFFYRYFFTLSMVRCCFISISEINGCQLYHYDDRQQHDDVLNKFVLCTLFRSSIWWKLHDQYQLNERWRLKRRCLFEWFLNGDLIEKWDEKTSMVLCKIFDSAMSAYQFVWGWISVVLWLVTSLNKINHVFHFLDIFFRQRKFPSKKQTFNGIIGA